MNIIIIAVLSVTIIVLMSLLKSEKQKNYQWSNYADSLESEINTHLTSIIAWDAYVKQLQNEIDSLKIDLSIERNQLEAFKLEKGIHVLPLPGFDNEKLMGTRSVGDSKINPAPKGKRELQFNPVGDLSGYYAINTIAPKVEPNGNGNKPKENKPASDNGKSKSDNGAIQPVRITDMTPKDINDCGEVKSKVSTQLNRVLTSDESGWIESKIVEWNKKPASVEEYVKRCVNKFK